MTGWKDSDLDLLLNLLEIDTVTPVETSRLSRLREAQELYAAAAEEVGLQVALFEAPPLSLLDAPDMPALVLQRAREMGPEFLENQPNLVLVLGSLDLERPRLCFNFHMDTVGGEVPVDYHCDRVTGRGIIDAKGLGVAILAGIREALHRVPEIADRITLIVQCVGGEEGGAMGLYGTKWLVDIGFAGMLNVVAEPSDFRFFDFGTASMTARIAVAGQGATDDEPTRGHNATLLLGAIANDLARYLSGPISDLGSKMCVGGLHTGTSHNRVYGEGNLLLNFAYPSLEAGKTIEQLVQTAFGKALSRFKRRASGIVIAERTAKDLERICTLTWLKRGLPVLNNRHDAMEAVLVDAGLKRHGQEAASASFTCDAVWLQGPGRYAIVLGPANLGSNQAHAAGEFIDLKDLDDYVSAVTRIVLAFDAHVRTGELEIGYGEAISCQTFV